MKKMFLLLTLFLFPAVVFASSATSAATSGNVEVTTATKVEYELPYPGILPDHPLYILKQVRDWILDKLIVDSVKKAEFYILQADKRLNMGVMLAAKGNETLSEQVISKGEKYMNNALTLLSSAKAQGGEVPAHIVDRLEKALAKHRELIEAEILRASEATKASSGSTALASDIGSGTTCGEDEPATSKPPSKRSRCLRL